MEMCNPSTQMALGRMRVRQRTSLVRTRLLVREVKIAKSHAVWDGNGGVVKRRNDVTLTDKQEDYDAHYRFTIVLQMSHPTMHSTIVTKALGVEPKRSWTVGEVRRTPTGTALEGIYRQTSWSISERFERRRDFFDACLEFIDRILQPRAKFVDSFLQTGGKIAVYLQIPGDANIGDAITAEGLARVARLGIEISVEVFPDMG